jgi:hypothetical protein
MLFRAVGKEFLKPPRPVRRNGRNRPKAAALLEPKCQVRRGGRKPEIMVSEALTMIKGTLPVPVLFDPPDR